MNQKNIVLVSFGYFGKLPPEMIAGDVEHEFSIPVINQEGHLELIEFYDPARRQYDGNKLLHKIDAIYASDRVKTIGVFNVDLFIPILTYIFGQAFLNGRSGIASVYRLSNERYGMPADELLLADRFRKEVIHELGHTFGLIHCADPRCVMRSGTYVEDIDQKSHHLCSRCRLKLEKHNLPPEIG